MFSSLSAQSLLSNLPDLLILLVPDLPHGLVLIAGAVLLLMAPAGYERRLGLSGLFLMFFCWLTASVLAMLKFALLDSDIDDNTFVDIFTRFTQITKWVFVVLNLLSAIGLVLLLLAFSRHMRLVRTK